MGFKSMFIRKKKSSIKSSTSASDLESDVVVSTTHLDELRQVFKRFDSNNDGKISSTELHSIITSLGQTTTDSEIQSIILEADKDGDGFISFDEFIAIIHIKEVDSDEVLKTLKSAFDVFDLDGNGLITAEELYQVLKGLGEECSVGECRRMICGVDSDGDGLISFEEFRVMMDNGLRFGSRLVDDVDAKQIGQPQPC